MSEMLERDNVVQMNRTLRDKVAALTRECHVPSISQTRCTEMQAEREKEFQAQLNALTQSDNVKKLRDDVALLTGQNHALQDDLKARDEELNDQFNLLKVCRSSNSLQKFGPGRS